MRIKHLLEFAARPKETIVVFMKKKGPEEDCNRSKNVFWQFPVDDARLADVFIGAFCQRGRRRSDHVGNLVTNQKMLSTLGIKHVIQDLKIAQFMGVEMETRGWKGGCICPPRRNFHFGMTCAPWDGVSFTCAKDAGFK